MLGEPEMVQRQPEWDRQLESIDNQELEIHQSQLRLMRDQTAVFIRDLEALRKEVLALRSVRGDVQTVDTSLKELRDTVALEGAKREASRTRFEQRLCSELEQVLGIQLHTSLEADREPLSPELVAQESAVEPSHGSILARLGRIEADARGLGSDKLSRFHRDLQELREVVGGEKLARERHQTAFNESVQAVQSSYGRFSERFGDLERSLAESAEMRSKELTGVHAKLNAQQASGAERLEQLEAALRDSGSRHAAELEALKASQVRQEAETLRQAGELDMASASYARRLEELERVLQADMAAVRARLVKACIPERMDYLESMMGRTSDKHERMLEKTREDVERLCMHIEASEGTGDAPEKVAMEQIQGSWGSAVRKQGEDLEVLRAKQSAFTQELQAMKSSFGGDLADTKAAMEARTAATKEQVQQLEKAFVSSAEKHTIDVMNLRDANIRHATDFATLRSAILERLADLEKGLAASSVGSEELAAVRSECRLQVARLGELASAHDALAGDSSALQTLCDSLQRRLEPLEAACGERAGRQESELRAASDELARLREELCLDTAALEQMQGRLEACERDGASIRELQVANNGLADEIAARDAELGCLTGRLDCVQRLVGSAAETSAKALETAHAGMEKLRNRIMTMEGKRHEVENLQTQLTDEKAAAETRLASLEGRMDSMGRRIGEAGGERAKELEAALNVRLSSLEGRLDSFGRRLSESGGERGRELEEALETRLAPLELRMEDVGRRAGHNDGQSGRELEARVEFVEDMLVKSKEAHGDVESLKATLAAHAGELGAIKEVHVYHASLADRLDALDRALGATSDRHDEHIADAHEKLEQLGSRLSACEEQSTAFGEPRLANTSLSMDSTVLDTVCESLKERVDVIDGALADSAKKFSVELEAIKLGHANHIRDLEARVEAFEGAQSASRDVHAKDLQAVKAKVDRIGDRLAGFDRQVTALGDLQTANAIPNSSNLDLEYVYERLKEKVDNMDSTVADSAHRLEGARAAQERQAKELDALKAASRQQAAVSERLDSLEASLRDADTRHADGLATAQSQLEHLRGRAAAAERHGTTLAELQRAQSASARDREDWEARHDERLGEAEEKLAQAAEKHERALEAAHARIEKLGTRVSTCERQGGELRCAQSLHGDLKALLESQLAVLKKRVDCLGETLGEGFDKRVWELEAAEDAITRVRCPTVEDRLRELEAGLGEANGRQGRQLEALRSQLREMQQRSAQEHEAREAWQDSFHESASAEKTARDAHLVLVDNRLKFFEDALSKSAERHSRDLEAATSANSKNAIELEAACSRVAQLEHDLIQERRARGEAGTALQQRLAVLERDFGESAAKHAEELHAQHGDLVQRIGPLEQKLADLSSSCKEGAQERAIQAQLHESLMQQLQEERTARENQLTLERKAREAQDRLVQAARSKLDQLQHDLAEDRSSGAAFRERVDHLEQHLGELTVPPAEELQEHWDELGLRADQSERKIVELIDLCDQFSVERAKWAELDSSIVQQLQDEKKAREAQSVELQAELSLERHAREAHERLVQEQFSQDRATRERFQDRLQDILAREGEARERRLEGYEAALQHEAQSREACARDLRELLASERSARDQHHSKHSELLSDLDARTEDAGERGKALNEHVQALQRSLAICDSMMREEIEVRCKETRHLWEAINGCGQPQARQAQLSDKEAPEDADAEVTDSYVPFPCQPLTSFLRLGGQGLAESERRRRIRLFSPSSGSCTPRRRRQSA